MDTLGDVAALLVADQRDRAAVEAANAGDDCRVVGAGAVVTADVEPGAIVAGVPARFIRWREDARPAPAAVET